MILGLCLRRSATSILSLRSTGGVLFVRKTSAVAASRYTSSSPFGCERSMPMLRLPRLLCSISTWTFIETGITPLCARPRIASPRSACSTLITSAPHSASTAEAAGTKVCSATSRMRIPFITSSMTFSLAAAAREAQRELRDDALHDLRGARVDARRRGHAIGELGISLGDGALFALAQQRVGRPQVEQIVGVRLTDVGAEDLAHRALAAIRAARDAEPERAPVEHERHVRVHLHAREPLARARV